MQLWFMDDWEMPYMPAYDYKCGRCGLKNELHHGWHDKPTVLCTYCNEPMVKMISPVGAIFKGTGWGKDAK
jgi:putative FmdB family regulatory protein